MRLGLVGGSEEACGLVVFGGEVHPWCWLRGSGGLASSVGVGGQLDEGQEGRVGRKVAGTRTLRCTTPCIPCKTKLQNWGLASPRRPLAGSEILAALDL